MKDLAILAAALVAAPPALAETFTPPGGPLTLTRTVRRALPDGKEVVATRRYEVRITREGDGYRVEGRLLSAGVQAPPSLEALAAIERKRSDAGLFPFRLDAQGLIASATAPGDHASAEAAGTVTRQAITQGPLPPARQRDAAAIVGEIVAKGVAGSGAQWPTDLFRPTLGHRTANAAVALPGGQVGSVTTTIDATRDPAGDRIERTVVTETGGSRRTTREIYTVAPTPK
jgi:hypothetical protein